jgi:hypothetical protein
MKHILKVSNFNQQQSYQNLLAKLFFIALLIFISNSSAIAGTTIFSENFESYNLSSFPSSGGWQLIYGGAGTSQQYVDNTHTVSGSKSFHLVGSYCWSANVYRPTDISSRMRLEAKIFVNQIVSCGCSPILACIGLDNPSLGAWGTVFGAVCFRCDGKIYAIQQNGDRNKDVFLMSYNSGTWYHVQLDVDLNAKIFDVYIDDALLETNLQILDSGMPTGVLVQAGHGGNPTIWFDDINVSSNIICPPSLGNAVDNTSLQFCTYSDSPWFWQNITSYNGGDAAQTGDIIDGQESSMQTTATGPGVISFYWKVSSEAPYDRLTFSIDGVTKAAISGETSWVKKKFNVPSGTHTLTWRYKKDSQISAGTDCGWVDKVVWCNSAPPATPKVNASKGTYSSKVHLSWNSSTGAEYYRVYRSLKPTGQKFIATVYTNSYDDTTCTSGKQYYYWIKSVNSCGGSSFSPYATGYRGKLCKAPSPPTGVSASDGTYKDKIRITWNASSGATSYELYRSTLPLSYGTPAKIKTLSATVYDDMTASPGITYYYWVRAKNTCGVSGYSANNKGYRKGTTLYDLEGKYKLIGFTISGSIYFTEDDVDSYSGTLTIYANSESTGTGKEELRIVYNEYDINETVKGTSNIKLLDNNTLEVSSDGETMEAEFYFDGKILTTKTHMLGFTETDYWQKVSNVSSAVPLCFKPGSTNSSNEQNAPLGSVIGRILNLR